jgi:hypothetical protein
MPYWRSIWPENAESLWPTVTEELNLHNHHMNLEVHSFQWSLEIAIFQPTLFFQPVRDPESKTSSKAILWFLVYRNI